MTLLAMKQENVDQAGQGFGKRWERGEIEREVKPGDAQYLDAQGKIGDPFRSVDTLRMMRKKKTITEAMYDAGEQFQEAFIISRFEALHAPDLARIPSQHGIVHLTEKQIAAKDAVWAAYQACGGWTSPGATALRFVLGYGMTIKEWAEREGWQGRGMHHLTASGFLVGALGVLADKWLETRLKETV